MISTTAIGTTIASDSRVPCEQDLLQARFRLRRVAFDDDREEHAVQLVRQPLAPEMMRSAGGPDRHRPRCP